MTLSAATAGNEEAFLPPEGRPIAPGDPAPVAMVLSFFPTAGGYYDYENFRYIYQYKDHLGNVRVSYVREGRSLKTVDANDYYPFGLNFLKPTDGISQFDPMAIPYNYKYQGQELQETGFYSFKWRNYMPDVGRFFNVDPLAEEYEDYTPYQFSSNQPVHAKEVEGLESSNDLNKRFKYDAPKRDGALSVTRSVAAWGSYTGMMSSQVRKNYINTVSKLETTNNQGRTAAKMEARSQTPALTRSIIESERPSSIEKAKTSGTANKTNSSYNSKAEVYGKAGTALLVVGATASAYNIATSDDPGKQAVKESAAWTGAILGGETGATIGSVGGPAGAAVGGVVGSILGGIVGGTVIIPNPCENCVSPDKN